MLRRSLRALLPWGGVALALIAGCGGAESSAPTTADGAPAPPPVVLGTPDRVTAASALLRLRDLPAGWTATPQNGQAPAACAAVRRLRSHARAVSPGFARGDGGIVHTVTLFPSAAEADRIFA